MLWHRETWDEVLAIIGVREFTGRPLGQVLARFPRHFLTQVAVNLGTCPKLLSGSSAAQPANTKIRAAQNF